MLYSLDSIRLLFLDRKENQIKFCLYGNNRSFLDNVNKNDH